MAAATGATASLRIAGNARRLRSPAARSGCTAPTGTLRGSVLLGLRPAGDRRRTAARPCRCTARGSSTASRRRMGELMCAVAEDRRAGELRGRRGGVGAAGAGGPGVRRARRRPRGGRAGERDRRGRPRRRGRRRPGHAPASTPRAGRAGAPPPGTPATATGLRPAETWEHLMRFRPGTPVAAEGAAGRGPARRRPRHRRAGALLRRRPTRSRSRPSGRRPRRPGAGRSTGPSTSPSTRTRRARSPPTATPFAAGCRGWLPPPTVWCSWYRYFEEVTADDVLEAVRDLDAHDLGVDVVQVDDGWSPGLGRGAAAAERFGSLARVVDEVAGLGPPGRHLAGTVRRRGATPRWPASTPTGWSARPAGTGASPWSAST